MFGELQQERNGRPGQASWAPPYGIRGYEAYERMRFNTMTPQTFTLANSLFWPVAIGFFGLGTGYFIWGGQALFGYPKAGLEGYRTMGMWGFWMPGVCQFLTGVYLF